VETRADWDDFDHLDESDPREMRQLLRQFTPMLRPQSKAADRLNQAIDDLELSKMLNSQHGRGRKIRVTERETGESEITIPQVSHEARFTREYEEFRPTLTAVNDLELDNLEGIRADMGFYEALRAMVRTDVHDFLQAVMLKGKLHEMGLELYQQLEEACAQMPFLSIERLPDRLRTMSFQEVEREVPILMAKFERQLVHHQSRGNTFVTDCAAVDVYNEIANESLMLFSSGRELYMTIYEDSMLELAYNKLISTLDVSYDPEEYNEQYEDLAAEDSRIAFEEAMAEAGDATWVDMDRAD
jgi:hypothetical protein